MRALVVCLVVAGCTGRDSNPSLVESLQVIAVQTDPPDYATDLGEVKVRVWVADPAGRGAEIAVWGCTDVGYGCVEAWDLWTARPLSRFSTTDTVRGGTFEIAWSFDAIDVDIPAEVQQDDVSALLWALACAPGMCELIDRLRAAPEPGSDVWRETVRQLANPRAVLRDVPLKYASLAVKNVPIRESVFDADNSNPTVEYVDGDLTASARTGFEKDLLLRVLDFETDDWNITTWTTLGRLDDPRQQTPTEVEVTWTAPVRAETPGRLWVVADDGRGGIGVWTDKVEVLP